MSEISVVVVGSTSINSVVGNGDTVNVNVGVQGGGSGAAATIEAGTVTTIDATQTATVTNVGSAFAAKFNFSLPRGATGLTGPATSLSIGSVSTGTSAAVSITGSAPSQALSFVLPAGPANSLSIGSVSTGTTAAVSVTGSAPSQSLSFVLPQGPVGPANSLSIGSVTTGTTAAVSITGTAPSQSLSFVLQPGTTGPANSLSIGSVSTGTTAAVSITGSAPSQSLSFVLPQGPAGPVSSLKIGTVITGSDAAATITGTAPTQTLNLVLPQGATGVQGPQGDVGPAGPANSLSVAGVTTGTTAAVSITGAAPSQQISFVIPQGPQGPGGPFTTVQVGTVATGTSGSAAKIDTVTSGGTVTLNFTIPRGVDGNANLADETPQPLGVARGGSALAASRADHVHPVPVIAYGSLTGVPATFAPSAHSHAVSDVSGLQAALDLKQASGTYVTLDGSGKISSSLLPSYVDDIVEAATLAALAAVTGESGKLYVTVDTRKLYRWSGSAYVEIAGSPGSTDAVTEGTTNLYFTTKRAADAAPVQSVNGKTGAVTIEAGGIAWSTVPTATTTVTKAGALSYDSDYVYVASDVNQWRRAAIQDWTTPTISISVQPSDQTAVANAATFSVTASATQNAELLYQWQRQSGGAGAWSNIATGLSATLSLDSLSYAANNGDKYRVVITAGSSGTGGSAVGGWFPAVAVELTPAATLTSGEATLTISAAISIVDQPQNVSLTNGTSATFAVSATTPGASLTYQWQSSPDGTNWTSVSGATSASFALSAVTETGNSGRRYRCIVSSSGYSDATSNAATLTVAPISVTTQPASQTGLPVAGTTPNYSASFSSAATSPAGAPTIQWEVSTDGTNFSDLSGQTNSSLALTGLTSSDSGKRYRAKFEKSGWNTVRSSAATLTVPTDTITVTQQPTNQTASVSSYSAASSTLPTGTWNGVSFANGRWFATPNDSLGGDYIATSADGVAWTKQIAALPYAGKWSKVLFGNGVYLTFLISGNVAGTWAATSTDGLSWTARQISGSSLALDVGHSFLLGGGGWFFATNGEVTTSARWVQSRDGSSWSVVSQSGAGALLSGFDAVVESADGAQLVAYRLSFLGGYASIAAVTSSGVGQFSSIGKPLGPGNDSVSQMIHDGVSFVAVGDSGSAFGGLSGKYNGTSWDAGFLGAVAYSVSHRDGRYVAATASGIASSADGISWVIRQSGVGNSRDYAISVEGGFLASINGVPFTSQNGLTWTQRTGSYWSPVSSGEKVFLSSSSSQLSGGFIITPGGVLNAAFSTAANTQFGSPAVQWQKSLDGGATWADIPGATAASLSFLPSFGDNGSRYRALFTKSGYSAVSSSSATLSANVSASAITIASQPASTGASISGTADFSVSASATLGATLSYQWQRQPSGGSFSPIAGETQKTLSLTGLTFLNNNGDAYRVVVSATKGAAPVVSNAATLGVGAPVISFTYQPTQTLTALNGAATLSASASVTRNATLSYQWQKKQNGVGEYEDVSAATSTTLSLTGLTDADEGNAYRLKASATGGATDAYSNEFFVLYPKVFLSGQPRAATAATGAASFSVTAASSVGVSLSYQWQKRRVGDSSFADISGATGISLNLTGLTNQSDNNYEYQVIVAGSGGAVPVTSSSALLSVPLPVITVTQQPASLASGTGSAAFSATATVTAGATLSYRWQRSQRGVGEFVDIGGATSASLSLSGLSFAENNGDFYRVVVSATGGAASVTSSAAQLTVLVPVISILTQPQSVIATGTTASLIVAASATLGATLSYQWKKQSAGSGSFVSIAGATSTTLSLSGLTRSANNGDLYLVEVSSPQATTVVSQTATLTVPAPVITIASQPSSQNEAAGAAVFSVSAVATRNASLSYQWQRKSSSDSVFANISGATSSILSLSGLTYAANNGDSYQVVVSGGDGASPVTSLPSTLEVSPPVITIESGSPADKQVESGTGFVLTATATVTRGGSVSSQWQKRERGAPAFVDISGAVGLAYDIPSPTAADNGDSYRVVFSSSGAASVTSRIATVTVTEPPVATILVQPSSTVPSSGIASFAVTAGVTQGSGLLYQWQKQEAGASTFVNVSGATSSTITLSGLSSAQDEGDLYRVVVTPTLGGVSVTSESAQITFVVKPVITITSQPSSQAASSGNATFTVAASVTQGATLSYQWQKRESGGSTFANVAGATSPSLSLSGLTSSVDDADSYRVVVSATGNADPVTSGEVLLTVNALPVVTIVIHPGNVSVPVGQTSAVVSVIAESGGAAVSYQWQRRPSFSSTFTDIAGATASTLTLSGISSSSNEGDYYRVLVSAAGGAVNVFSNPALLTFQSLPVITITSQPALTIAAAGSATFGVTASVSQGATLSYQWQKKSAGSESYANISGATSASISLAGLTVSNDNGDLYRVVVSATNNATSVISSAALLRVNPPPAISIVSHPASGAFTDTDTSATFSVVATIASGFILSYQWQKREAGSGTFTDIAGATNQSINVVGLTYASSDGDSYRVTVSGSGGAASVVSNPATITIFPRTLTIQQHPVDAAAYNQSASFSVFAVGSYAGDLTYQWQRQAAGVFSNIPGATSSTLRLTGLMPDSDNGSVYRVVVSFGSLVATSNLAYLTVSRPDISITTQPRSTYAAGGDGLFSVVASVSLGASLSYQWQVRLPGSSSFVNVTGFTSTTDTLRLTGLTSAANNNSQYRVIVSASGGANAATSSEVTLYVPLPYLAITSQPYLQAAQYGEATFSVTATSDTFTPASYQWQKQESGVGAFANIQGAVNRTLALSNLRFGTDNGDVYRVVLTARYASGDVSTLTSDPAPLVVANNSGQVYLWGRFGIVSTTYPYRTQNGCVAVASGGYHALAIRSDGGLLTWGLNSNGQLGLPGDPSRGNPTTVGSDTGWTAVSAGQYHSAGISSGRLYAWGSGGGFASSSQPTQVGSANNWVWLSCGRQSTFAINSAGELWGAEYGTAGGLARIGTASNWSSVYAGDANVIAITTSRELWSWGTNASGQVGDGTLTNRPSPVRLGSESNWLSGACGGGRSYAINTLGDIYGWGAGPIGDGTENPRAVPTRLSTAVSWQSVSTNGGCVLATTGSGQLWGWGLNPRGVLGPTVYSVLSPTRIGPETNWANASVGSGGEFATALTGW
jgi:hypothetical protein